MVIDQPHFPKYQKVPNFTRVNRNGTHHSPSFPIFPSTLKTIILRHPGVRTKQNTRILSLKIVACLSEIAVAKMSDDERIELPVHPPILQRLLQIAVAFHLPLQIKNPNFQPPPKISRSKISFLLSNWDNQTLESSSVFITSREMIDSRADSIKTFPEGRPPKTLIFCRMAAAIFCRFKIFPWRLPQNTEKEEKKKIIIVRKNLKFIYL